MLDFPYQISPVPKDVNEKLMTLFKGERDGFCQVGPQKWIMPMDYKNYAGAYYNFKLRPDDVWIVTYPRTGTTVTQELLWMLSNNFNYKKSAELELLKRFPFIEFHCCQSKGLMEEVMLENHDDKEFVDFLKYMRTPGYEVLDKMPSPRHIKTHLPLSLLPPNLIQTCKVVYNARNPKDVVESYFHHNKLIRFHDYQGDFKTYWDLFKNDLLLWSPYWEHIREAWEVRSAPNLFFLFYEDLVKDMPCTIRKLANFLGKTVTEEQVNELTAHLEINNFREKVKFLKPIPGLTNSNPKEFIRKGKSGCNELFSKEMLNEANEWTKENSEKIGIQFPV